MAEDCFFEVTSKDDVEKLLDATLGFHDSIATRSIWEGAEFVNRAGEMELNGYGVLVLEISSQFKQVLDIRLLFEGVESIKYSYQKDYEGAVAICDSGIVFCCGSWEIEAASLKYRWIRPEEN